jgi:hypothetical protein
VGFRLFGERDRVDWNVEGVWQWGSFGDGSIRAWTLSADLGYRWADLPLRPRFGIKMDAISGDSNPADGRLERSIRCFQSCRTFGGNVAHARQTSRRCATQLTVNVAQGDLSLSWE